MKKYITFECGLTRYTFNRSTIVGFVDGGQIVATTILLDSGGSHWLNGVSYEAVQNKLNQFDKENI